MLALIIQLISGAVGGNVVGALAKNLNMGTVMNSVAGAVGGGGGAALMSMLGGAAPAAADAAGGMDIGAIVSQVASGGVGGGVLMAVVGIVKNMMAKGE